MTRIESLSSKFKGCSYATIGGETINEPSIGISASRIWAAPGEYPPENFSAYGIIAFRAGVTEASYVRYMAICTGFVAALPNAMELQLRGVVKEHQMATVWPILGDHDLAGMLNSSNVTEDPYGYCEWAVRFIDLPTSLNAIKKAKRALGSEKFNGQGPYLLAWSPAITFGQSDVPVLVWDLSNITNSEQATSMFSDWAVKIEGNPQLWSKGWSIEDIRITLRLWADKYGADILVFFGH